MPRCRFCVCVLCAAAGLALALGLLGVAAHPAIAQAPPAPKQPVSFINDVAPIFKENCFTCHNAKTRKGKLDMTTFKGLRKGGGDDPVTAGQPDDSELFQRIVATGARRMPPKDEGEPLGRDQVAVIRRWIQEGARLDAGLDARADLMRELRVRWKPPAPMPAYDRPVIVTALAFTPDNKQLVVGGQHELTVWDTAQGKLVKRIATRAERAKAMTFLPDGKLAVAGGRPGQEGDVRIYNLQGGNPRVVQGVPMLDGVYDRTVLVKELVQTDDEVLCLAVSPDGKKLVSGGCDRLVRVWDLNAGYDKARLEQTIENHADWVFGVVFTPDGRKLLTASRDKTAKLWDLQTKESVLTFPDHQNGVFGVAVKPDGKIAASVGQDNQVRYWNATADGKQIRASGGHGMEIYKVLWHPKLPILVTCSADKTVRIWNPDSGAVLHTLSGHTDYVYGLALSSDGKLVASGSWNGEVKVWNVADGKLVRAFNASPGLPLARK